MSRSQIQNFTVERLISVFNKETSELVAEHYLSSFDLAEFKQHFGVPDEDDDSEMVYEYNVAPKDVDFLSKYLAVKVEFDFERCSYFLSCYRVDN